MTARSLHELLTHADEAMRAGVLVGSTVWPSGIGELDQVLTGGMRSGELVLIGGSEGTGKTTLAFQILRAMTAQDRHTIFFSYEHEPHTLMQRLLAQEAAAAGDDRPDTAYNAEGEGPATVTQMRTVFERTGGHRGLRESLAELSCGAAALDRVDDYAERLHLFAASPSTTLAEIAQVVGQVREDTGQAPAVLVDYLQKVPVDGVEDEGVRATRVAEGLKDLALRYDVPVLAITAADREALGAGHRMRTRDLRGSSALAYEADIVLILSSKEDIVAREHLVYDLSSARRFAQWTIVTVEKNRHGVGKVEFELEKDFDHGRYRPEGRPVVERLIEERVFTT